METAQFPVSARKLAATLWEINTIPSPEAKQVLEKKDKRRKAPRVSKMLHVLPQNLSDPSNSPFTEKMDRGRVKSHRRRSSIVSQKLQVTDRSFMEIDEAHSRGKNHGGCIIGIKTRLNDVSNCLATSNELVEVLSRVCGLDDKHSRSMSLVSALYVELDRAQIHVDQLIREQRSNHDGIEHLMRHFAKQKAAWKRNERERIRDAISCIAEELEVEKKLRRQTERFNKKLGKELADTAASLSEAMKELESKKRAKEILEQVRDELARGIGEDRATVEELKRESAKAHEEMEKEREMIQFADVLREERVQMKLSEAKCHFEEKNAVVEKLRNELETYLGTQLNEENVDGSLNLQRIKELEAYLKKIDFGSGQMVKKFADKLDVMDGEECEADDSADSDLHSIELNMENNDMCYKWSYARGNIVGGGSNKFLIENDCKERKSLSETKYLASQVEARDYEDEIKRHRSVESLRDHILSSNKIAPIQSFPSPTRQWSQSMHLEDAGARTGSPVLKADGLNPKLVGSLSEGRTSAR
ncbi:Photosystem I subunit O [Hibiscus syriacus]|uniref:Photosystem I subunit O n=2 Tax=Hibiscus syriacus TaxID=106335 RepID=A0A6A2ZGV1_HIBSY|nr:Photosystem I subunit O [Hibiscus syriacus]